MAGPVKKRTGGKKKGEDPSYDELRRELAEGNVRNLYVFHGEETYLRDISLKEMKKRLLTGGLDDFNFHSISGKDFTLSRLHEAVDAVPMMSERTLTVVTDWDMDKGDKEGLMELLKDLPDYVCLVFLYDTIDYAPDNRSKLAKLIKEKGKVVNFTRQNSKKLIRWVDVHFQDLGHGISDGDAEYLISRCGDLMTGLLSEIEKISAYAKHRQVTRQDIDAVTTPRLEAAIFNLTDAIATKNFDRAFQILGDLLHMQIAPLAILPSLSTQVRKLYTARLALEAGKDIDWFMELWGLGWRFQAENLYRAAPRFSYEWYHWALLRCEEADRRLKSTGADGQEVLVELLLDMAQHQAP